MTGQEHAEFIKKLGAFLASKELTTKMLLRDEFGCNDDRFHPTGVG